MNTQGEHMKSIVMQGLAVVGFVAILFVGLWGTVQVVKFAPRIFSNLAAVTNFTSVFIPKETITINTPNSLVSSGTIFELTWSHVGKPENGTYTFTYACKEGLSFEVLTEEGTSNRKIACDTPFEFSNDINPLYVTPTSATSRFVDVPIIITSFNEAGESTTLDDSFLTIVNESVSGSSLPLPEGNKLTAGEQKDEVFPISDSRSASNVNGRVDLKTTITDTGIVNPDGTFTSTSSIKISEKGAIKFSVTNIGSKTSDNWVFNVVLPTFPMHIFHSTSQKALAPGDRIDFTLGFDQLNKDLTEGVITVNADPTGSIHNESNRDNNVAQTIIVITK